MVINLPMGFLPRKITRNSNALWDGNRNLVYFFDTTWSVYYQTYVIVQPFNFGAHKYRVLLHP